MPTHTASRLFDKNIKSAKDCLVLYNEVEKLDPQGVNIKWILRAIIVFTVSALDAFFHDKVKYRVGRIPLSKMPPALAKFKITINDLPTWAKSKRRGNVLRNWVTRHLATIPLQSKDDIADALRLVGIQSFWNKVEPDKSKRELLLKNLNTVVNRRNKIAHEGDRLSSRGSGKKLRPISRKFAKNSIRFAELLVKKIERAFPN